MSHFPVMVIGPDYEAQLAPYHEFECTGIDDQYVKDVDITAEFLEVLQKHKEGGSEDPLREALEWYGFEDKVVENLDQLEIDGCNKYGYAVIVDGEVKQVVNRTNPNKKWDWYQVGGRWTGFLKLKPECKGKQGSPGLMTEPAKAGWVDSTLKGNVDWDGMREEAARNAAKEWDKVWNTVSQPWESWESVRSRFESIEDARQFYHSQPAMNELREAELRIWDFDHYLTDRKTYMDNARFQATSTFAFVKDGQWFERGEMGWFGAVSNEVDEHEWRKEFNQMLDSLPDDTLISVVDCHI